MQPGVEERCRFAARAMRSIPSVTLHGRVSGVTGLSIQVAGLDALLSINDRIVVSTRSGRVVPGEIVGFRGGSAQAMAYGTTEGIGPGSRVVIDRVAGAGLAVSDEWIGRVIDPWGNPLDGRGPLPRGETPCPLRAAAPEAAKRARLGPPIDLGVRVLDAFTPCLQGQRLGLFAGSGVGKSTLLAMLARNVAADVIVLGLVGERGREVREFLEDDLGPEGASRAVTVVATSDAPPLIRREAAYAAMAVAEYFRDQGRSVLLLMDSVTRFCLALREISLSLGELPATRGYPPSVFAELPRLLERAGPGLERQGASPGQITAIFSVLVEGSDHEEPVADAVRGILDGHVVLDRRIAEAGRYPAVDILRSLSRTAPVSLGAADATLAARARAALSRHAEMADLVRLGAYQPGHDLATDAAIALAPKIELICRQARDERVGREQTFRELAAVLEQAP